MGYDLSMKTLKQYLDTNEFAQYCDDVAWGIRGFNEDVVLERMEEWANVTVTSEEQAQTLYKAIREAFEAGEWGMS